MRNLRPKEQILNVSLQEFEDTFEFSSEGRAERNYEMVRAHRDLYPQLWEDYSTEFDEAEEAFRKKKAELLKEGGEGYISLCMGK